MRLDTPTLEIPKIVLTSGVDPEETLLLAHLLANKAKVARKDVLPGEYEIDTKFTVHVVGTCKVGENYEQRIVAKARPWAIVSVLLEEMNEKLIAAGLTGIDLDMVVTRAAELDKALEKKAQERADLIAASLKAETTTLCNGKTTFSGDVTIQHAHTEH